MPAPLWISEDMFYLSFPCKSTSANHNPAPKQATLSAQSSFVRDCMMIKLYNEQPQSSAGGSFFPISIVCNCSEKYIQN